MASMEIFRERLHTLRLQAGLTQEQLGVRAGITGRQISTYEHGHAKPRALTGQQIAEALGVSLAYLLGEEDMISEQDGIPVFSSSNTINDIREINYSATNFSLPIKSLNNRRIIGFRVEGDSLSYQYVEGQCLLIDLEQTPISYNPSHLFLMSLNGNILVRRIQRDFFRGDIVLSSNNIMYPPLSIPEEELDKLIIIGRVIGFIE